MPASEINTHVVKIAASVAETACTKILGALMDNRPRTELTSVANGSSG